MSRSARVCPKCWGKIPAGEKHCSCSPAPERVYTSSKTRRVLEPHRKHYNTKKYEEERQRILHAQHGLCFSCAQRGIVNHIATYDHHRHRWKMRPGGAIHHITKLRVGGEAGKMIGLCRSCHHKADFNPDKGDPFTRG